MNKYTRRRLLELAEELKDQLATVNDDPPGRTDLQYTLDMATAGSLCFQADGHPGGAAAAEFLRALVGSVRHVFGELRALEAQVREMEPSELEPNHGEHLADQLGSLWGNPLFIERPRA
jgi:hypothetical protein